MRWYAEVCRDMEAQGGSVCLSDGHLGTRPRTHGLSPRPGSAVIFETREFTFLRTSSPLAPWVSPSLKAQHISWAAERRSTFHTGPCSALQSDAVQAFRETLELLRASLERQHISVSSVAPLKPLPIISSNLICSYPSADPFSASHQSVNPQSVDVDSLPLAE